MTEERLRYIRSLQSLAPLHTHTDAIGISEQGKVEILTKLEAPIDEFGIPRPQIMIDRLLATIATKNYMWPGRFDEHHLATPKADFTVVRTSDEGDIGSAFRGLSCLKVELPRQMHNYSHALFELPGRPSIEVMRQAVTEVGHVKQLQHILNEHLPSYPHTETEQTQRLCITALHGALERMDDPQIGILPDLESIAAMELSDLRKLVSALLQVQRFSRKHLIHPAIRKTPREVGTKRVA